MKKTMGLLVSMIMLVSLLAVPSKTYAAFKDVPRNHWAYNEINFLTGKQVIKGFSNGTFNPLAQLTKKDAAIMLVRAMKLPMPAKPKYIPSDMKPTMGGYKEVVIALDKGMFSLSNKKFNPNQPLTRKEMAKALAIAYNYKGSGKNSFRDVSKSNSYYKFIDAIVENDIGSGYQDGTFKPDVIVNRAQFSVFLSRIYEEPLEYVVKQNGKVLHTVKKQDEAIKLALKYKAATVHPVSNSLMKYTHKTGTMSKAGIRNGVLIYSGGNNEKGTFTPDYFRSYLVKDIKNNQGTLFDTFIITARAYSQTGLFLESADNKANYKEWKWYADKTFTSSGPLVNLNAAAKGLNRKVNVYIGIPYPKRQGAIVDLNGKSKTNTTAERQKMASWYMDMVQSKWDAAKYSNLVFKGYYWMNETVIHAEDELLVTNVSNLIHKKNKSFIYSPHATSTNFDRWQLYGFDAAFLQPNTFREKFTDSEVQTRLHTAFVRAQIHGSGINIEIDSHYASSLGKYGLDNFRQYREMGERYGLPGRSLIMYQDVEMVHRMANFTDPSFQKSYEELKLLIK